MSSVLILLSLAMGAAGLVAFFWSIRDGQYDDLDGAAERIFLDDDDGRESEDVTSVDRANGGSQER